MRMVCYTLWMNVDVLWEPRIDIHEFLQYLKKRTHFDTHIERSSSDGISVSFKRDAK
jgi:hypothetical protein